MQNVLTSNRYNFVVSEPIWTIPSALETGEKRATFYRNSLKVRHVEIKEKSKMISHIAPTDMLVGRYNNSNSFNSLYSLKLSPVKCCVAKSATRSQIC